MSQSASQDQLSRMHALLAEQFLDILQYGEKYVDGDGEEQRRPLSAAMVAQINKFLKDNDVTAVPAPGTPLYNIANLPQFDEDEGEVKRPN